MAEWWTSLGSAGQVFACVAIPATIILFLQTLLTIIGLGGGHDDGADTGHDLAGGNEIDEQVMLDGIKFAHQEIIKICEFVQEIKDEKTAK